jgi:hypothetical protein
MPGKCYWCGKTLTNPPYFYADDWVQFCSNECHDKAAVEFHGGTIVEPHHIFNAHGQARLHCSDLMYNRSVLCHHCTQRLDKIIKGKCNKNFIRVENLAFEKEIQ